MRDGAAVLIPRRLLGVLVALLAGFSTALAEVHDINSSSGGGAADVERLYSPASNAGAPDRSALDAYSPVATASPRWFEAVLGWTGIEIWLVMLRDQFLADTTNSLGDSGLRLVFRARRRCIEAMPYTWRISLRQEQEVAATVPRANRLVAK